MKLKILSLLVFALPAFLRGHSQEVAVHDNLLSINVGVSDDLSRVPITLTLENPTVELTALEIYLNIPDGATLSAGTLSSDRCAQHQLIEGQTENGHFVSVVSPELDVFVGNDGAVCTWYCDMSMLPDGTYSVGGRGMFAVGVNENGITCYTASDQTKQYTIQGGTLTGIVGVESEKDKYKSIYNLKGMRLAETQQGLNIINGKKVIL